MLIYLGIIKITNKKYMNESAPKKPAMTEDEKRKLVDNPEGQAAHEEANMVLAQMGQKPDETVGTFKRLNVRASQDEAQRSHPHWHTVNKYDLVYDDIKPTKEDYTNALAAVEELKKLSATESNLEKLGSEIGMAIGRMGRKVQFFLEDGLANLEMVYGTSDPELARKAMMESLETTESKLKKLRETADKLPAAQSLKG